MTKIVAGILALLLPIQAMAAAPLEKPAAPDLDQYLVPVTLEAFEPNFESQTAPGTLETLSLGVPALQGPFQNRVLDDLGASHLLHLLLLVGNGRISPVRIHTPGSMAGLEASVDFKPDGCYRVILTP